MLRLERQCGLRSVALKWFSSYLSGCLAEPSESFTGAVRHQLSTFHVPCHKAHTELGPRLFIGLLYTADLEDHVAEHGVSFAFADDTQLYVQCRRDDVMSAVRRLENCIDDVSHCMDVGQSSKVECGQNRTALGRVTSWSGCAGERGYVQLQLKTETVIASDQVRVLGETMSSDLSLDKQMQRLFVLLASSAQTGPTFTRRGVCGHAGPRFHDVTRRLLQCHSRGGIQVLPQTSSSEL